MTGAPGFMTTHTPRPWIRDGTIMAPTPGALEIDIRFDDNWENCCTVKGPNAEANVLLIAAAPELLEACELIASAKGTVDVVRAVEKARAAITKALPEQGS